MTPDAPRWTAIVLAGQRPGVDPLAAAFGETYKALIPIAGVPMVLRVTATLRASPCVARIVVLAQQPAVIAAALPQDARIAVLPSGAGIATSIAAVAGGAAAPWPILVTTADHPLLTPAMVEAFAAKADGRDVAVAVVERGTFAARFPDNRRTWLKLRGGAYSGANLFALGGEKARGALALWAGAERDRKRAMRLFWHFGPLLALRAISRTITLQAALDTVGRRLGLDALAVLLDQPEAGIDVDKRSDHAIAEALLRGREGAS